MASVGGYIGFFIPYPRGPIGIYSPQGPAGIGHITVRPVGYDGQAVAEKLEQNPIYTDGVDLHG